MLWGSLGSLNQLSGHGSAMGSCVAEGRNGPVGVVGGHRSHSGGLGVWAGEAWVGCGTHQPALHFVSLNCTSLDGV